VITIVHNNHGRGGSDVPLTSSLAERDTDAAGLRTAWGFAAVVEMLDGLLLFDAGLDGEALLHNARALGIDPADIGVIVLSHSDKDHTDGLAAVLPKCAPGCTVFAPAGPPRRVTQKIAAAGAELAECGGPTEIRQGVVTTGAVSGGKVEHGLVIMSPLAGSGFGPVLLTGCAHPGIARMAGAAAQVAGEAPGTVLGGFHMAKFKEKQIRAVSDELRELGVRYIGPTHCTGERAREFFRREWAGGFIDADLGAVIDIAERA